VFGKVFEWRWLPSRERNLLDLTAFESVIRALASANVRYLIVGGMAVNAHGYIRLTTDIDLVLALDADNIRHGFQALTGLGYRPLVPVTADDFAQQEQRERWRQEKNMLALNFFNPALPGVAVDVFVYEPFDFETEYDAALEGEIAPNLVARFASIRALIEMKMKSSRARDIDDLNHLLLLQENISHE
jgi:hypothetical protein